MKKLLLIFTLSFLTLFCFDAKSQKLQISTTHEIGKIANGSACDAILSYSINKDTTYTLTYMGVDDNSKSNWASESVKFKGDTNTINSLYDAMKSVFKDENKSNKNYSLEFTLGDSQFIIKSKKSFGIVGLTMGISGKSFIKILNPKVVINLTILI